MLVFLVTLVHLVVISVFSAATRDGRGILAQLDADAVLSELVDEVITDRSGEDSASAEKLEEETDSDAIPANPLVASAPVEPPAVPEETESSSQVTGTAEPTNEASAINDTRLLAGRVELPRSPSSSPPVRKERLPSQATEKEAEASEGPIRSESVAERPLSSRNSEERGLRVIRPITKS